MQQVPESSVAGWVKQGQRSLPSLIDWYCPACSRLISFSPLGWRDLGEPHFSSAAKCPGCRSNVLFFALNMGTGYGSLAGGSLFIFPSGKTRTPIPEVLENEELSVALKNAYKSSVNVVNTREWSAAAVLCRRLLEGITKTVLPPEQQKLSLGKQLEELPRHRDLARPLVQLGHAVRIGGNLGAHFDLEKEPDQHVSTLMLELCEDLLQYLFVLPLRIQELQGKIERLGAPDEPQDPDGNA